MIVEGEGREELRGHLKTGGSRGWGGRGWAFSGLGIRKVREERIFVGVTSVEDSLIEHS